MAIQREADDLANYLGDTDDKGCRVTCDRHDYWLFYFLHHNLGSQILRKASGIGGGRYRRELLNELKLLEIPPRAILEAREDLLVPQSCFEWIENNERMFRWFICEVTEWYKGRFDVDLRNPLNISPKDRCIAVVDSLDVNQEDKKRFLDSKKIDWLERLEAGKVFSWVGEDDEPKNAELALSEILAFRPRYRGWSDREPLGKTLGCVLEALDSLKITLHEARSASKAAKAKLSQVKFRGKPDKKQLNVHIRADAVEALDRMAGEAGISKAKIVELLIVEEFAQKKYITPKRAAWMRGDVE